MTALSDFAILDALRDGRVLIEPFDDNQLGTDTYDVRLGNWVYYPNAKMSRYSPYLESDVKEYWGKPINACNGVILIPGYTTILAHTLEYIGGLREITTQMHARSSVVRTGLSVCKCGGKGDVGYAQRWTMEISNLNKADIVLPVGVRVAQISFDYVGPTRKIYDGKYGLNVKAWKPDDMLPKLYMDRDIIPNMVRATDPTVPFVNVAHIDMCDNVG